MSTSTPIRSPRRHLLLGAAIAVVCSWLLAGCAAAAAPAAPTPPQAAAFPITITDTAERSVTIKQAPARIISLSPSNTEFLFALGLDGQVVGVDDYSNYPAEAKNKEKVGGFAKTNVEKVVGLAPDLVVATEIHLKAVVPELERRGLTVLVLSPDRLAEVADGLKLLGQATGRSAEALKQATDMQQRLDAIAAKVRSAPAKPRVFFELDAALTSAGPETFVDDLVVLAGGENIAADAKVRWPKLSAETIVLKDPQVVLLADHGFGETPDKVAARPGWAAITAIKDGRLVAADPDLVNRPGPRAPEALEAVARALHPELFK